MKLISASCSATTYGVGYRKDNHYVNAGTATGFLKSVGQSLDISSYTSIGVYCHSDFSVAIVEFQ